MAGARMLNEAGELLSVTGQLHDIAAPSLLVVLWVSLVSVATLQLLKQLTPMRANLQKWRTEAWLAGAKQKAVKEEFQQLVELAAAGGVSALFSLPPNQLAGQIGVAAQMVFEQPERYSGLLGLLAVGVDDGDLSVYRKGEKPDPALAARINNQIQRNIDRLFLDLGRKWRFHMRLSIMGISAMLLFSVMTFLPEGGDQGYKLYDTLLEWLILGAMIILAGYLGPVIYDTLARIQGK